MGLNRRRNFQIGCGAAVLLLVGAVAFACAFELGYLPIRRFDAQLWRDSGANIEATARVEMVDSLVRSGKLDGLTRDQVLKLLGPPTSSGYFDEWDMVYWLGNERGLFSIDSEWLVIRLGQDGRVTQYQIQRD